MFVDYSSVQTSVGVKVFFVNHACNVVGVACCEVSEMYRVKKGVKTPNIHTKTKNKNKNKQTNNKKKKKQQQKTE